MFLDINSSLLHGMKFFYIKKPHLDESKQDTRKCRWRLSKRHQSIQRDLEGADHPPHAQFMSMECLWLYAIN